MADAAAAGAQPNAPADAAAAAPAAGSRGAARDARRTTAITRLSAAVAQAAAAEPPKAETAATPAPKPEAQKPSEAEKPDPATERGLRAVEQAKRKFLDEQNAAKAELDVQRAEVARLRKEAEGKVSSRQDLKGLKPTDLLDALDHYGEDELDILSRAAYARTKAGKTDPRAQAAAQEASRAQGSKAAQAEVAELRETIKQLEEKLTGEFRQRDAAAFQRHWVDEAVKAIPADKPTFLSKLHANEPDAAKRELLTIGAELEKANDNNPPTQAEVIEEFEARKRASLKAMGLDPDALLAPPKAADPVTTTAATAKPRTLDVTTAPNITRPANAPKTREERRDRALANLADRQRATADQT